MRAHIVIEGIVTNTVLVESLDALPGLISAENGGMIGDRWDGTQFIPVPVPVKTTDEIIAEIAALDLRRIRPLAEGDANYLGKLNSQIAALRKLLR